MKYMGSKRKMLSNGLGKIIATQAHDAKRFADLFAGSSAVVWYVAENVQCPVIATDLQLFAVCLAEAVITRDVALNADEIWQRWSKDAEAVACEEEIYLDAEQFGQLSWKRARKRSVQEARLICGASRNLITRAYGGHYFSPSQAVQVDALRKTLPEQVHCRRAALAALIWAASQCAASPGHTAQPFQPTQDSAPFLFEAWQRDVLTHAKSALEMICPRHARNVGRAMVCDAEGMANQLDEGDLAFLDPPYSGVHYSRFYHVLETIARGECTDVTGVGRYPHPIERPKSDFSIQTKSKPALERLFSILAERKVRSIVTFPQEKTSNGLSGTIVRETAEKYFKTSMTVVNGRFSTLGGNLLNRKARIPAYEIILQLEPIEKRRPRASAVAV
jgi:adenine-specific DNA-methyltransferase